MFADRMKALRKAKGVTQKQVAIGTGISERQCQEYEYGKIKPSFDALIALADYFEISLDELVGRTP